MATIYEPSGKAREYSPLALNLYSGCDHGCKYCYVPNMFTRFNPGYDHNIVSEKNDFLKKIESDCKKGGITKQVLLSFTGDPYCQYNDKANLTRRVLEILLKYGIKTAILTKGGHRALKDMDIIKQFGDKIKVGATLTFDNQKDSYEWEPGASIPQERIEMLSEFHKNKIKTWVSFEPVIVPEQTINLLDATHNFVNHYKVGKLNHNKAIESNIDWNNFLAQITARLRHYRKLFYIKNDLAYFKKDILLSKNERDSDYLAL